MDNRRAGDGSSPCLNNMDGRSRMIRRNRIARRGFVRLHEINSAANIAGCALLAPRVLHLALRRGTQAALKKKKKKKSEMERLRGEKAAR